jgi:hypothetical protein
MRPRKEIVIEVIIGTGLMVSVWAFATWWAFELAGSAIK